VFFLIIEICRDFFQTVKESCRDHQSRKKIEFEKFLDETGFVFETAFKMD